MNKIKFPLIKLCLISSQFHGLSTMINITRLMTQGQKYIQLQYSKGWKIKNINDMTLTIFRDYCGAFNSFNREKSFTRLIKDFPQSQEIQFFTGCMRNKIQNETIVWTKPRCIIRGLLIPLSSSTLLSLTSYKSFRKI